MDKEKRMLWNNKSTIIISAFGLLVCLILVGGCQSGTVRKSGFPVSKVNATSAIAKERAKVLEANWEYDDPKLKNYVENIGYSILSNTSLSRADVKFTILDRPDANAYALPEGNIFITRGILALINSEAELAAILGHEIAHLEEEHTKKIGAAARKLMYVDKYIPGLDSRQLARHGKISPVKVLSRFSQDQELEADALSAKYLLTAGYDIDAIYRVVRTLFASEWVADRVAHLEGKKNTLADFETHPEIRERLQSIINVIQPHRSVTGQRKKEPYFKHIDGMIWGQNPARGVLHGNEFVEPNLKLRIRFPENWGVFNTPQHLIALSQDRAGEVTMVHNTAPEEYTAYQVLRALPLEELHLYDADYGQQLNSYFDSATGTARLRSAGRKIDAWVYLFKDKKDIFLFLAVDGGEKKHRNDVASMIRKIRPVEGYEKKSYSTRKLRLEQAHGDRSWGNLGATSPFERLPSEQIRLLNGALEKEEPPPIGLIKVIRYSK